MIVIPMAGLSRRFSEAGYKLPKYRLPLGDGTVFDAVLHSFEAYFDTEEFLFIGRDDEETKSFVARSCVNLGLVHCRIAGLGAPTRGQAETVWMGLGKAEIDGHIPLTTFNIDTIRPRFRYPSADALKGFDGFFEVFRGIGDGWLFARTRSEKDLTIVETAEKRRISNFCSTGLYNLASAVDFTNAFKRESARPPSEWAATELYVAPLYNHLIEGGKRYLAVEIDPLLMIPCSTLAEYEALRRITCAI